MQMTLEVEKWGSSSLSAESTLHQIAPYIGKVKSLIASNFIRRFSKSNDVVYDPFSGSGTVGLEAWIAGRNVILNDLSSYAYLLSRAKLNPPASVEIALQELDTLSKDLSKYSKKVDLRKIPPWVRSFYHPQTLREIISWSNIIKEQNADFVMANLMGILHHQRPGFLSFPSSHTVPYLRENKFPRKEFPALYEYRSVRDRLERKLQRALRRVPILDRSLMRECYNVDASSFIPQKKIDLILTSPPYMKQLDYGRDNRLRLWFLGCSNWQELDNKISPHESQFFELMQSCLKLWKSSLNDGAYCILILGDADSKIMKKKLPDAVVEIALNIVGGYSLEFIFRDPIPDSRRVRRNCHGSNIETILVFKKLSH